MGRPKFVATDWSQLNQLLDLALDHPPGER